MACGKHQKLPPWIRIKVHAGAEREEVDSLLAQLGLNTVCAGAQCPNRAECYHHRTATFMIMGNACTRNCKFCAIEHTSHPAPLDPEEPAKVALAVEKLGLRYAVITCVTRDDIADGGAAHFAETIKRIKALPGDVKVEVLTSDLKGDVEALKVVLEAGPAVFNHNIETVERLSAEIRSKATYRRTLEVLHNAAMLGNGIPVKSGLMVGLGETDEEVEQTMRDLRDAGVNLLTIGQYLSPGGDHPPVERFVEPEKFEYWKTLGLQMGFAGVAAGPLVRSSYEAGKLFDNSDKN
jgi:lipoic acid synthetase